MTSSVLADETSGRGIQILLGEHAAAKRLIVMNEGAAALEMLQCNSCRFFVREMPVRCCKNGHTICSNCYYEVTSCPKCREATYLICSFATLLANNILGDHSLPCIYQNCPVKKKISEDLTKHIDSCPYRIIKCPVAYLVPSEGECRWRGQISELNNHLHLSQTCSEQVRSHFNIREKKTKGSHYIIFRDQFPFTTLNERISQPSTNRFV